MINRKIFIIFFSSYKQKEFEQIDLLLFKKSPTPHQLYPPMFAFLILQHKFLFDSAANSKKKKICYSFLEHLLVLQKTLEIIQFKFLHQR